MHILIVDNALRVREELANDVTFKLLLPQLAHATVLLEPAIFVDDEPLEVTPPGEVSKVNYSRRKILNATSVVDGRYGIERNNLAIEELKVRRNAYRRYYAGKFASAMENYRQELDDALSGATVVEKTRTICPGDCVETYYEYENITWPVFSLDVLPEVDADTVKNDLTPETGYLIEKLGLLTERTFDGIIAGIEDSTRKLSKLVYGGERQSDRIIRVGGMVFQSRSSMDDMPDPFVPIAG